MKNQIHNEDCFTTISKLDDNSIDLIITSPPYNGVKNKGSYQDSGDQKRYDVYQDNKSTKEYLEWSVNLFKEFDRITKPNRPLLYNFSYHNHEPMLPYLLINEIYNGTEWMVVDTICWKKPVSFPNMISPNKLSRKWEFVFVFCRKSEIKTFEIAKREYNVVINGTRRYKKTFSNFVEAKNNDGCQNLNKATFSSDLISQLLLRYANENYVIYDPFIGIGTTAIACINENKRNENNNYEWIGSELSTSQCEYANKRIMQLN